MTKNLLPLLLLLTGCSSHSTVTRVKRLGPIPQASKAPAACKIVGVLPGSPAQKAGFQIGDTIHRVNGAAPADAVAVSDLIQNSGPEAAMDILDAGGKTRTVKVTLNKEKPRLGASCDLAGWVKSSVSAAGNEAVTMFQGPYALTLSAVIDKELTYTRVRISNHSDRPLTVRPELLSAKDGNNTPMKLLSPFEVIYFMHGDDAVPLIQPPAGTSTLTEVPTSSPVRQFSRRHKKREDWSQSDETYVQANVKYLNKESLWPSTISPGEAVDGLIFFMEPGVLPLPVQARIEGYTLGASFGVPLPSQKQLTYTELVAFFEAQKKGTPVRLTLKKGKVFVGKYSSYDAHNEIVWFDTPSGILLTTSSFGLKHIAYAEVISQEPEKKLPASEPVN